MKRGVGSAQRQTANARRPSVSGHRGPIYARRGSRGARASATRLEVIPATASAGEGDLKANAGVWKGVLSTFNRDGGAQELPPQYVPDAFREWGETLYEWTTVCECEVDAAKESLTHAVRRQVPLAGCESVKAQYEPESQLEIPSDRFLAFADGGSFALAPRSYPVGGSGISRVHVDVCLHIDADVRVRMHHTLMHNPDRGTEHGAAHGLAIFAVKLYLEHRLAPTPEGEDEDDALDTNAGVQQNGLDAARTTLPASSPALGDANPAAFAGCDVIIGEASSGARPDDGDGWVVAHTTLLPQRAWSRLFASTEGGCQGVVLEAGVADEDGKALGLAAIRYEGGELAAVAVGSEAE